MEDNLLAKAYTGAMS